MDILSLEGTGCVAHPAFLFCLYLWELVLGSRRDLSSSGHPRLGLHACWDNHTLGLHTLWLPQPLLLLCLRLLEHFLLLLRLRLLLRLQLLLCTLLHALLLLHALSSSSCLSGLSLVLECPQSRFSRPSCWV